MKIFGKENRFSVVSGFQLKLISCFTKGIPWKMPIITKPKLVTTLKKITQNLTHLLSFTNLALSKRKTARKAKQAMSSMSTEVVNNPILRCI